MPDPSVKPTWSRLRPLEDAAHFKRQAPGAMKSRRLLSVRRQRRCRADGVGVIGWTSEEQRLSRSWFAVRWSELNRWSSELDVYHSEPESWSSELDVCYSELSRWSPELGVCHAEPGRWSSELDVCYSELDRPSSELEVCYSKLDRWSSQLDVCYSELGRWSSELSLSGISCARHRMMRRGTWTCQVFCV